MYIIIYYLDTVQIINICIMMYYVYIILYTLNEISASYNVVLDVWAELLPELLPELLRQMT